jgi:hypothetical protein
MNEATIEPTAQSDLFDWLSNVELGAVFSGGSARVLAQPRTANPDDSFAWSPAWVDDGGLWIDDDEPGYVISLRRWRITRYY